MPTTPASTDAPTPVTPAPASHTEHEGSSHGGAGHDWDDTYREGKGFSLKPNALLASSI